MTNEHKYDEFKILNDYEIPLIFLYSMLFIVIIKVIKVTVYRIGDLILSIIKHFIKFSSFHLIRTKKEL